MPEICKCLGQFQQAACSDPAPPRSRITANAGFAVILTLARPRIQQASC